jgi:hypothetical protein
MIYCPKCGTANRDGSKFCNECGEKLGTQTQLKCPECGALNSVQNVFCTECGARLPSAPVAAPGAEAAPKIKGLSLPTKPSLSEEEPPPAMPSAAPEDLPAWLQELSTTPPGESVESPPVAAEERFPGGTEQAEEIPDWLRDLRASLSEKPGPRVPERPGPGDEGTGQPLTGSRPSVPEEQPEPLPTPPEFEEGEIPDWLAELRPPAAPAERKPIPPAPNAEEPEEEIPDWLAELQAPAAPAKLEPAPLAPSAEEPEEEIPDWLAELRPPAAPAKPEPAPPAPSAEEPEEEIADWLAELQAPAAPAKPEPAPPAPSAEEEVPDWVAELQAPSAPAKPEPLPPVPVAEEPEGELPDWLAELQAPSAPAKPEPPPPVPVAEEPEQEPPDWLAELRTSTTPAEPEPVPPAASGEERGRQLPTWLAELQSSEALPVSEAKEPEEEPPDWLAGRQPLPEREGQSLPEREGQPEAPAMPQWLMDAVPAAPETTLPAEESSAETEMPDWLVPAASGGEQSELLERAEIPEWLLALKPGELTEEAMEETEGPRPAPVKVIEETGLLAGLRGTLPVEMLIAQPRAAALEPETAQEVDTPQARLFAEIVAKPPSVAPQTIASPRTPLLTRLSRLAISLVLLIAVTFPLLLEESPLARSLPASPPVMALHDTIELLDSNAQVLVAFDYDPTTSGEMDVVAQAIVGHLGDRGSRIVAISLLPAGAATAQRLLEEVVAPDEYANLGYLPGQVAAVRDLGMSFEAAVPRDFQGVPASDLKVMSGIAALQDFDLIIELAATQDSLRWWIEQARTPYDVPMGAGVSASLDPLARPYYETDPRQLVGLVAGVPGAAMYESLQGAEQPLVARLDAQLAGHAVLVLVLLVGNGVYFVRRGTRRGEER